ncbi:MAG TPA: transglutaminase family protein, partial [Pseudomonadales bacterium]
MTIRVALKHQTRYVYDRAVRLYPHTIRLRPAPHSRTPIPSYSIKVEPAEHFVNWQQDPFGNYLARYVFPEKTRSFSISVELIADLVAINPFDFFLEEHAEHYPFRYGDQLSRDLIPYLEVREDGPALRDWLKQVDRTEGQHIVGFLVGLNQRLQQDIGYLVRMEPGVQTCEETLTGGSGSCRDSAWLLVQICRHLGLAARFVSGYLVQLVEDVKPLDGPAGPAADFTDLHAWAEVYLPGAGWIGFDPTSGLLAGEGHIPLACTPDPAGAAPVTGSTDVAEVTFEFANSVERIREDPRVTKPYGDAQWNSIVALGDRIETELDDQDVRLTMGGEPTFVSIDDMDGDEWNFTAMSEKKLELATTLLLELKSRFAPQGVVHFGQGKWYPGEPLPRWALSLFWRTDGQTIVSASEWIDTNEHPRDFTNADARRFVTALAEALDLPDANVVPGYEDTLYHLWKEGALPENVTPEDSKLEDPMERKRLRERFVQGLTEPTGFALPLKWRARSAGEGHWQSSPWPFRDGYMFLLPGDSPIGYRLPLGSLPWELPDPMEIDAERDPFEPREDLPPADGAAARRRRRTKPATGKSIEIVHTALCVQVRDGRL